MSHPKLGKGLLSLTIFTLTSLISVKAVEGLPSCYLVIPEVETGNGNIVDLSNICESTDVEGNQESFEYRSGDVLFENGLEELEAGNVETALHFFNLAIEKDPNNSEYHATRGEANRYRRNFDASLTDYRNASQAAENEDDILFVDYYQTVIQGLESTRD